MSKKEKSTSVNKKTLGRILKYIKRYSFLVVLSLICAAISVVLTLYAPIITGHMVDKIVGKGAVDFGALKTLAIRFVIVVAVTAVCQWIMNILNNKVTYHVVNDVRTSAYKKLEQLPLSYVDSHTHGDIVSRVIADVDQFSDGLLMGFTQLFTGVMTIVGTLCFMLSINAVITVAVVVITPVSLFVAAFIAKKTYHMFRKQAEIKGEMTSLVNEMVENQKVVTAFSMEENVNDSFNEVNKRLNKAGLDATFFSSITNPCTRFVNSLVYTGVGIIGAVMAIKGRISVGQLTSFLSYANQYTKPFNEISGVVTELQNALASAARVFELIDEAHIDNKDVWKRANLDRKHFSKIQCDQNYHPKKKTVMALCIALKLDLEQSKDLLARADWAFSPSSKVDLIVQKAIIDKQYDIMQLNVTLFKYTNEILGV